MYNNLIAVFFFSILGEYSVRLGYINPLHIIQNEKGEVTIAVGELPQWINESFIDSLSIIRAESQYNLYEIAATGERALSGSKFSNSEIKDFCGNGLDYFPDTWHPRLVRRKEHQVEIRDCNLRGYTKCYSRTLQYNEQGQLRNLIDSCDESRPDPDYPITWSYQYEGGRLIHVNQGADMQAHRSFDTNGNLIMEQSFLGNSIGNSRVKELSDSLRFFFNERAKAGLVQNFLNPDTSFTLFLIIYNYNEIGLNEILIYDFDLGVSRIVLDYNSAKQLSKVEYWKSTHLRTANEFDYIPETQKLLHRRSIREHSNCSLESGSYINDYYFNYLPSGDLAEVFIKRETQVYKH
jgi:hypothetical protein